MRVISVALGLLFASTAVATPWDFLFRRAGGSCGAPAQAVQSCFRNADQASVTSICSPYLTTTSTITYHGPTTTTATNTVVAAISTMTAATVFTTTTVSATTTSQTTTIGSPLYSTTISTTMTAAATRVTITETNTQFTCNLPAGAAQKRAAGNAATCTAGVATGHVSNACLNCGGGYSTSTVYVSYTVPPSKTITSTVSTTSTPVFTTTPTMTILSTTNIDTVTATSRTTLTTDTTTTFVSTPTVYVTTTATVTSLYVVPAAFRVYYTGIAVGDTARHYASATRAPGGSGTMLAFAPSAAAGVFSIDGTNALADQASNKELATNAVDEYPYLYEFETGQTTAMCSACNDNLMCSSGNSGTKFAVCDGFLALGTTFGNDGAGRQGCTVVPLQIEAVS